MIALARSVPDVQPLIIPSNLEATSYEGFLHLPSAGSLATALWLRLSDISHGQGTLSGAQLECSIELSDLIEVLTSCCSFINRPVFWIRSPKPC